MSVEKPIWEHTKINNNNNVIKEIVKCDCVQGGPPRQERNASIKASFANCSDIALNNLVELIQEDTQDCLGIVKQSKGIS